MTENPLLSAECPIFLTPEKQHSCFKKTWGPFLLRYVFSFHYGRKEQTIKVPLGTNQNNYI